CTADEVLKHKDAIYKELMKVDKAIRTPQIHIEWLKVIVHNVSCKRYEEDETLMNALAHEIQNMNSQVELVTAPRWLTHKNVRTQKENSSVVIAVKTQEQAKALINRGVWIDNEKKTTTMFIKSRKYDRRARRQSYEQKEETHTTT